MNGPLSNDTQKHSYDELGRLKKLEIVDDATGSVASYSEESTFDAGRVRSPSCRSCSRRSASLAA